METEEIPTGLTKEQALARFHLLTAQGELLSGGAAFARLWSNLPGLRLLGRLGEVRPMPWLLERAYLGFLRIRPWLQKRFKHAPQAARDARPPRRP